MAWNVWSDDFEDKGAKVPLGASYVTFDLSNSFDAEYKPDWDIEKAYKEAFENSVWAFKCIDTIAANQAKLPIVFREDNSPTGALVDDDRMLELFNTRSNEHETSYNFRYRISSILLLSKAGVFIEIVRDNLDRPMELQILPPELTSPVRDKTKFIKGFKVELSKTDLGRDKMLKPKDVLWIRRPHPLNPYSSQTPLEAAELCVEIDTLAQLYNRNFLKNDGRPGGLLVTKSSLSETDRRELEHKFRGSLDRSGDVRMVESEGIQYLDLGGTPRDAAYSTMRAIMKEEILAAFGVPESVIGNASNRTFSNAAQEGAVFWNETMAPHLDLLARAFDELDPSYYVDFDTSLVEPLELAAQAKSGFYLGEYNAGLISLNEYRHVTGKPLLVEPIANFVMTLPGKVPLGSTTGQPLEVEGVQLEAGVPIEEQAAAAFQGAPALQFDADSGSFVEAGAVEGVNDIELAADEVSETVIPPGESVPVEKGLSLEMEFKVHSVENKNSLHEAIRRMLRKQQDLVIGKIRQDRGKALLAAGALADFSSLVSVLELDEVTRKVLHDSVLDIYRQGVGEVGAVTENSQINDVEETAVDEVISLWGKVNASTHRDVIKALRTAAIMEEDEENRDHMKDMETTAVVLVSALFALLLSSKFELLTDGIVLSAFNFGMFNAGVAAASLGKDVNKTWYSRGGPTAREMHLTISGRTVGIFDSWTLPNGQRIRFPGDPLLGPDQTVNCRCFLRVSVSDDDDRFAITSR